MTLQTAEVVLIRVEFWQTRGSKVRPAIVLLDTGDEDFVAAPITSQARRTDHDLEIGDWQAVGLNVRSTVRVHKLTVLSKADIVRRIGVCTRADREALLRLMCRAFCPA